MAIELVTQFSSYVDEQFSTESKKSMMTNQDFGWDGAHSVKIYKATTAKMNDYDRAGTGANASRYGKIESVSATTEEMMLKRDRSFTVVSICSWMRNVKIPRVFLVLPPCWPVRSAKS